MLNIACGLVLDPDNRCLLVRKRNTQAFMQPGGKIEVAETAFSALQRELFEELKVVLAPQNSRKLGHFVCRAENEHECMISAHLFLVRLLATEIDLRPCAELAELRWIATKDPPPHRIALLTAEYVFPIWHRINSDF